jgi:hypothetical protein
MVASPATHDAGFGVRVAPEMLAQAVRQLIG